MSVPTVSIVMPVYNGGPYLIDAVASIIEQTFVDWELICVNDGSTDHSGQVLDWLREQDNRIQVCHQSNGGIVSALNTGCELASGNLIGRMDCDDTAMPTRLLTQVAFMQDHPNCVVLGSGILEIDQFNRPLAKTTLPATHNEILHNLLNRGTGHFHPTTMFRREAFHQAGRYRKRFQWVEDHDLWLRMSEQGELANLDEILLCYRQHASSVCWQRSATQRELINQLLRETYDRMQLGVPPASVSGHTKSRAMGGPGKWARTAAKGGFSNTAFKLLGEMWRSNPSLAYKFRMTAEVVARSALSAPKSILAGIPDIPQFPDWRRRYETAPTQQRQAA